MFHKGRINMIKICACIGPIGSDEYCPCKMKEKGLPCSNAWTDEKKKELDDVLLMIQNKRLCKLQESNE